MEDILLLDGICQDMATREVFQPPCYIPRTAHRLIFPKSSQLAVSSSCPETKLLIIAAKETDELEIMEDEIDDLQCELVSNASSRCLYHKVARNLSCDLRTTKSSMRNRKRRRNIKRVNYRESVWGKPTSAVSSFASHDIKDSAKYYKPSYVELSEKLHSPIDEVSDRRAVRLSPVQNSEHEIYNTMLSKGSRS